jgi:hypothetical protein
MAVWIGYQDSIPLPWDSDRRLPMEYVVRPRIMRSRPTGARRKVIEQFDAWSLCCSKGRDPQPCSRHVIQALLFRPVILTCADDFKA